MSAPQGKKYDLLVVTDATASMGSYLNALRSSMTEILELSRLSGAFSRLGVIAYHDYGHAQVTDKSVWNDPALQSFVKGLRPYSTGDLDWPEAAKTALIEALAAADDAENTETVVIWYADAPPHHASFPGMNREREKAAFPEGKTDWVYLTEQARKKRFTVFCITPDMPNDHAAFFIYLSQMTGGLSITQKSGYTSVSIAQLTMDVILNWMGQTVTVKVNTGHISRRFIPSPRDAQPAPTNEDGESCGYLPGTSLRQIVSETFDERLVTVGNVASTLGHNSLAKRFADRTEEVYRAQVYESLANIINDNIMALTRNPVFGQLWRAVCKESSEPKLQGLLDAFSTNVAEVTDVGDKAVLQQWLNDSFDATEAIEEMLSKVPPGGPVVYLDYDADVELTRTELLEVSKSCYSGVLKKVSTLFTHLKIKDVESDVILGPEQRSLPLNLKPRQLFRTIPHLVVPGTLYPGRAAAITAIIALFVGVPFLRDAAIAVLAEEKGKWLDLEIPENISFECGKLLLTTPVGVTLTDEERRLYEAMRRYKFIELNLDSTLNAMLPWKPEKTRGVGDFMRECSKCHRRRSVTLMSEENIGVCGICSYENAETLYPEHDELTSCWVECHDQTCRAQYVVEEPQKLNIRPKCYYCRKNLSCPALECTRCTNRVVVPTTCRQDINVSSFLCPACAHPEHQIQVLRPQETTIRILNAENGLAWLGYKDDSLRDVLFQGRSAFKMIQAKDFTVFDFEPLNLGSNRPNLTLGGKPVPLEQVRSQVEGWAGRGEIELGSCSLCFEEKLRPELLPACGRSGCIHRADSECLDTWYGKSEPGRLLNLMQLACPFCRRRPAPKVLNKYNTAAAALGGVQAALEDRHWFYAWCMGCGFAKRAQERACCGEDWTPNIHNFWCDDCRGRIPSLQEEQTFTPCPSCGVMVERIAGCNHITCTCGAHFCHVCGGAFGLDKIYQHMAAEHGGYFNEEVDWDNGEPEDSDDEADADEN